MAATRAKELATFLGFENFYHSHIGDLSSDAGMLCAAAKPDSFQWKAQCEEAFQQLNWKLIRSALLAHTFFSKPFLLSTDATGYGVAGLLLQEENGIERPIGYFSKVLPWPEKNYCT